MGKHHFLTKIYHDVLEAVDFPRTRRRRGRRAVREYYDEEKVKIESKRIEIQNTLQIIRQGDAKLYQTELKKFEFSLGQIELRLQALDRQQNLYRQILDNCRDGNLNEMGSLLVQIMPMLFNELTSAMLEVSNFDNRLSIARTVQTEKCRRYSLIRPANLTLVSEKVVHLAILERRLEEKQHLRVTAENQIATTIARENALQTRRQQVQQAMVLSGEVMLADEVSLAEREDAVVATNREVTHIKLVRLHSQSTFAKIEDAREKGASLAKKALLLDSKEEITLTCYSPAARQALLESIYESALEILQDKMLRGEPCRALQMTLENFILNRESLLKMDTLVLSKTKLLSISNPAILSHGLFTHPITFQNANLSITSPRQQR